MIEDFFQLFWRHLEELRNRLFRCVACFFICFIVCFNFIDQLIPFVMSFVHKLIFTSPADAFGVSITLSLVLASLISSPYILYHVWAFIGKALHERERRFIFIFGPLSVIFFFLGACFAFYVAVPMAYAFLMSFSSEYLVPMITVDKYFNFVGHMILAFGVAFELPLVMAFLAFIGLATPEFLRQKRRYMFLIIVILSAIMTPPDVASQIMLALPLIVLYEVGILFVSMAYKGKQY